MKPDTATADSDPHYPADYFARVTHQGVDWVATANGWMEVEPGYSPADAGGKRFDEAEAQKQADQFLAALRGASKGSPTVMTTLNHRQNIGYTRSRWMHRCDRFNEIVTDDGLNSAEKLKALSALAEGSGIEELAEWSEDLRIAGENVAADEDGAEAEGNDMLQAIYDMADGEGIWLGL